MSAGKPITEHGLRLRKKKNYYSCPSVNHAPPPGNVAKKERDRERKRERERRLIGNKNVRVSELSFGEVDLSY